MARIRSVKPHVVRVDPHIWESRRFAVRLTRDARWAWFSSLFHLANVGRPDGVYPHDELVRELGTRAEEIAKELIAFGLWEAAEPGYLVRSYEGCAVHAERRAAIPDTVRQAVFDRDGHACLECGATDDLTLDHIHPWSRGGPDTEDNLRVLCRPCNSSKGARV